MDLLDKSALGTLLENGCTIVDTRNTEAFGLGFIEGAVSVPFGETFINKLNDLLTDDTEVVFVVSQEEHAAVFKAVKAAGINNVKGYYSGNYETWQAEGLPLDVLIVIDAEEFAADYRFDEFYLIDIRPKAEYDLEHAEDSENIALNDLEQYLVDLETGESYYLYSSNAEDAVTAGSLFKKTGFQRVRAVAADLETIKQTGIPWYVPKKKSGADK
jgi:rhodanese-related sulfurtransferase